MTAVDTATRRSAWGGWSLASPLTVFIALFFLGPFVTVVQSALAVDGGAGTGNFLRAVDSPVFWRAVGNTLRTSLLAVAVTAVIALPFAYGLVRKPRGRQLMLSLLFAPLVINGVVRIYGLQATLNLVNQTLLDLGLIRTALPLNYSMTGIVIGLVVFQLPLMAITVYSSLARLDHTLIAAAHTLGADRLRTLLHVVLPSAVPGLVGGSILVFANSAGSYILPAMLGGGRVLTLPQLVYNSVTTDVEWGYGSALALILVVLVVPFLWAASTRQRDTGVSR
ncbi:ABC transporter permease [Cellulomonas fimi]|uniref:ABC transporter permease n=1 Tax=Cellulomonas sp. RIT-PI-Y TaxID=3035297 RepID=UPI0021DB7F79